MSEPSDLYFRQVPIGPMANFIYFIGSRSTRTCVVVDPAWDTDALVRLAEADDMKIVGALVTHYHPDHCGGGMMGFRVPGGVAELIGRVDARIHVHKLEADGLKQVTGVSEGDLVRREGGDRLALGDVEITFIHTPGHTPGVSASSSAIASSPATLCSSTAAAASTSRAATRSRCTRASRGRWPR
ncbi:MBL fold metallo-hydrolase [Nannocystis pusilla]|uniref:MBL fold metallo-hydrolase n=1 Tax=Nannocystis pusilla TaxID=889268 RepID=A0A9X3IVB4_9BACT|nr:MBL fold metallo-hydrolase [Nannocystis pusilla]MCY1004720.1 MBL fold metallo-hydrolase [Nannocystis pusilla]